MWAGRPDLITNRHEAEEESGRRGKKMFAALYKSWDLHKKPSITVGKRPRWGWKVKGLSYVRRSFHSQGTNLTSSRARRDEGKPLLLSGRTRPMGFQSVATDYIPGKKRLSANGPSVTPQSFILSDSSLLRVKSFNPHSLFCLAYMSEWKSCATALSWFFTASWSIFLIRWEGDKWPPRLWPCRGYWQEETSFCSDFFTSSY